jgi:penicillin G amidase
MNDIFKIDNSTTEEYIYKNNKIKYSIKKEKIKIKGIEKEIEIEIKNSIYGPIINEIYNLPNYKTFENSISLNWLPFKEIDLSFLSIFNIHRIKEFNNFKNNFKNFIAPSLSIIFSNENNIGFISPSKIPIRNKGHSGRYPIIGNGEFDWNNFIPFENIPYSINSKKGYYICGNNRITPIGYNYSLGFDYDEGFRSFRIEQLILNKIKDNFKFSFETIKEIQLDVKSTLFEELKFLINLIQKNMTKQSEIFRNDLEKWNGLENINSIISPIFETWLKKLNLICSIEIEIENEEENKFIFSNNYFLIQLFKNNNDILCKKNNLTCVEFAANAFIDTLFKIEEDFGGSQLIWGVDSHEAIFENNVFQNSMLNCLASVSNIFTIGFFFNLFF